MILNCRLIELWRRNWLERLPNRRDAENAKFRRVKNLCNPCPILLQLFLRLHDFARKSTSILFSLAIHTSIHCLFLATLSMTCVFAITSAAPLRLSMPSIVPSIRHFFSEYFLTEIQTTTLCSCPKFYLCVL